MIIATVKKLDGTYLDHGKFTSEEAAIAWFQPFIDRGVYGTEPTIEFQDTTSTQKTQAEINAEAQALLSSTDWQIIRHQDQLLAGETPSLSEPELQTLLAQRKAARESVV